MDTQQKKIGIALSGGGIRATIFHLGVLKWAAENHLLEEIIRISSVSGASLCIGLIFSHNNNLWPSSEQYLQNVLPAVQKTILTKDIQTTALGKVLFSPWWWNRKVNLLAKIMQKKWKMKGSILDLDHSPLWEINCTTFETGKRFYFSQERMGDYKLGYVNHPDFLIADAVAASAGFPVLIGPYKMNTSQYAWMRTYHPERGKLPPRDKYIHLWDGGVYDNLGMEGVYKLEGCGSLIPGINYLIVSNASGLSGYKKRQNGFSGRNLKRLLDISTDQVSSLRSRDVMDYFRRTKNGLYFYIGGNAKDILSESNLPQEQKERLAAACLTPAQAYKARKYPTTLNTPSEADFNLLLRHGYEVAKCTQLAQEGVDPKTFRFGS